ncbi:hypothetical protein HK104_010043 [Borealophlyctis nickersoniae]|nr:hypothetical protein HK104_010043 [Borealophlyctis nickersoniae]
MLLLRNTRSTSASLARLSRHSANKVARACLSIKLTSGVKEDDNLQDRQQLVKDSTVVGDYWDDVMKFSHEPASRSLAKAADAFQEQQGVGDESIVRKLLSGVIRTRVEQGDMVPSLMGKQCVEFYERLNMDGRAKFLRILGRDFDINRDEVAAAAEAYLRVRAEDKDYNTAILAAEQKLRQSLHPLFQTVFTKINKLPFGMQFLVNLRADLLKILTQTNDPYLRNLNDSLKGQLQQWFGIAFLDLERISWSTPAAILEKIVRYEAVHAIPTWQALKQRLGPGRLCYAFFHRGMPQEPLIFVQIALTKDVTGNIQSILNNPEPGDSDPTVAIFYSISSSQKGLSGVDLGNFLIKRVVKEVQQCIPTVDTFCTLSPIPGFRRWLDAQIKEGGGRGLLLPDEVDAVRRLRGAGAENEEPAVSLKVGLLSPLQFRNESKVDLYAGIVYVQQAVLSESLVTNPELSSALKPILLRLCSRYILLAKKGSFVLDPVANFHIRNGACVHRLNWMGDTSEKGFRQSFGIMANYTYVLPEIEVNNQNYVLDGRVAVLEPVDETLRWAVQEVKRQIPEEEISDGNGAGVGAKL